MVPLIAVCGALGCEESATWAVHPLPFDDDPHPPPILACDAHAAALLGHDDPTRPPRGVA